MINDYGNTFNMFDEVLEDFYFKNRKFLVQIEGNEMEYLYQRKLPATWLIN